MAARALLAFLLIVSFASLAPAPAAAQGTTCAAFDAWPWAQTVFDSDPAAYQAFDPDQDGIACPELTVYGFAPVLWTSAIPAGAEPVQVTRITDGDTFDITDASGNPDTVRMYHIDAPETTGFGGGPHCGGDTATAHLQFILQYAPGGTVYLEYDQTQRDRYDRRLAYVWYELDGQVYLVNEAMVRDGYAESETFEPDVKYRDQLNAAEQWSVEKVTGVRLECGKFNQPPGSRPSEAQIRQAWRKQPNQGQLPPIPGQPTPTPAPAPIIPTPTPIPAPPQAPPPQPGCDPSYPTVCIPPIGQTGDLDCGDIGYRRFQVVPPDPHNFDGDYDGVGCESG